MNFPKSRKVWEGKILQMWQSATFTTAKTWNQESCSSLAEITKYFRKIIWKHHKFQIWPELTLKSRSKPIGFVTCNCLHHFQAMRNSCERVNRAQGSSQTHLQVFCPPSSSLMLLTDEPPHLKVLEGWFKTFLVSSLCAPPRDCWSEVPQVTNRSFYGIKGGKLDWRVPRGRLGIES